MVMPLFNKHKESVGLRYVMVRCEAGCGGEYIRLTSQQSVDFFIAILKEFAQPISEPINVI